MNSYSENNDETLVTMTLLGDESAYEELVTRHQRAVIGTAYSVTGNSHSAEDASQDAFVSAWMNLASLRNPAKFRSWVCSISRNCALAIDIRYRSAIPELSLDALEDTGFKDEDEWVGVDGGTSDIRESVEALSEKLRETVKLHYFEDKTVAEIAAILNVPEGTVKWRLSEGRKQLRKGYGIMEKTYNENESLVSRVRRQVEALKLWQTKADKKGFAEEFKEVMKSIEALEDSSEKNYMLADTLILSAWWIPGAENDELYARIKKAAEDGHNDLVMRYVAQREWNDLFFESRIDVIKKQIPQYLGKSFTQTAACLYFWLGNAYRETGKSKEAIESFGEVLKLLGPADEYYAAATAAISAEKRLLEASGDSSIICEGISVTGEIYKKVGDRLYFWSQPGYLEGRSEENPSFYNLALCDSIILDYSMKVGDKIVSSDGNVTLTYVRNDAVCDTPAGHFENCSVYVCEGGHYGFTHSETYLCENVGIVRQSITRNDDTSEWVLKSCRINGGDGLIPLAVGNRWEFDREDRNSEVISDREVFIEVTASENNTVTAMTAASVLTKEYADTWYGKTLEIREAYCKNVGDHWELRDVSGAMKRVEEIVESSADITERQRVHTAVSNTVMRRIFDCDSDFNPNYTEAGRWNFFSYSILSENDGKIKFKCPYKYSFEWKDMSNCVIEEKKMCYSFLVLILQDATGVIWSDEWVDGYHVDEFKTEEYVTKDISVKYGERVVTPAGVFENCAKLCFDFRGWGYAAGRSTYYFAEHVGIVRYEHPMNNDTCAVWELTEYRGEGEGYFPIENGLFRRYEPDKIGNGCHASLEYTFVKDKDGAAMFKDALGNQDRAEYEKAMKK